MFFGNRSRTIVHNNVVRVYLRIKDGAVQVRQLSNMLRWFFKTCQRFEKQLRVGKFKNEDQLSKLSQYPFFAAGRVSRAGRRAAATTAPARRGRRRNRRCGKRRLLAGAGPRPRRGLQPVVEREGRGSLAADLSRGLESTEFFSAKPRQNFEHN